MNLQRHQGAVGATKTTKGEVNYGEDVDSQTEEGYVDA
jgi:hypothetical protein